jgi:ribosome-associated protein
MSSHRIIDISVEPIELCKLLKIASMVGGGGEAKIVISEGAVIVNNEVEFQKRKKIRHGDIVEFDDEIIKVNYVKAKKTAKNNIASTSSPEKSQKIKNKESVTAFADTNLPRKRKPISF